MKTLSLQSGVDVQGIFDGGLALLPAIAESQALMNHAKDIAEDNFQLPIEDIHTTSLQDFVRITTLCKSTFTNDSVTKQLMTNLLRARYGDRLLSILAYDVPRLRIIPNSSFLSAGVSYNYKPHRDTWYGGQQNMINHWMPVCHVNRESTFYIAPTFYHKKVSNSSEQFDLDEWDKRYRPMATVNIRREDRPHPIPLTEISDDEKYYIVIPNGSEMVFSGHHIHGSGENTTNNVRFSVDYRVAIEHEDYIAPNNIDSKASGNYSNYMISPS